MPLHVPGILTGEGVDSCAQTKGTNNSKTDNKYKHEKQRFVQHCRVIALSFLFIVGTVVSFDVVRGGRVKCLKQIRCNRPLAVPECQSQCKGTVFQREDTIKRDESCDNRGSKH